MQFLKPEDIENAVAHPSDLRPTNRAGKIFVHEQKISGHLYLVWSKYDEAGVLSQRAMVRKDLLETDSAGYTKMGV